MSKPNSGADFSSQIAEDRTWRIKEISDFKSAVLQADEGSRRVLLRGLITICYAHWEGYVRFAARKYLEYVARRKFQFGQIDRQFLRNSFLPRLGALSASKVSLKERCALVDEILDSSDKRFSRVNENLINTKANLNFDVFSDICLICSVPLDVFQTKATFIDVFLLKRRNEIAHGEDTYVALQDLDELTNETVGIMRAFGDQLDNHVSLEAYKSA